MYFAITLVIYRKGNVMNTLKSNIQHDHLSQYTSSVQGLHVKIALVVEKQKDVAESLGRAAAALRSIGALNIGKKNPNFGKFNSYSQERFSVNRSY